MVYFASNKYLRSSIRQKNSTVTVTNFELTFYGDHPREGIDDDSPWLRSLDLEYSRIDLAQGLYYGLEAAGGMRGVPDEREVQRAVHDAPRTRAAVRGGVIQRFPDAVVAAQWDHVIVKDEQGKFRIDLTRMFSPSVIESALAVVQNATAPKDLRKLLNVPD